MYAAAIDAMCHYRKWPASFDHFVGASEQRRRHVEAKRLGGRPVDHQFGKVEIRSPLVT
jgi:hypothetical protein